PIAAGRGWTAFCLKPGMEFQMDDKNEFAAQIEAAKVCLNSSLAAFNARDLVAYERTFNFPSIRLASNSLAIVKMGSHQPGMYNRSELMEWNHSGWDRLEVIHAGALKVHFEMRLTHFRKD